ncbi:MarR family EPS-associated transcriptional regulator [Roseovarius sp. TE539]|uniref:MarR family EPS-associated transcriptional regulator n=1 Tax=Roseovarius sp. TE539 TaxID=2249812 RepID=UPI00215B883E|nr:MarR family EPS-associated transcriptional regulator [Roseovarius sp. TE539]
MTRSLDEDICFRVLRVLQQRPTISQRELAAELGIALGRVNYVLKALIEKGFVKIGNFSAAQDKRRYAYILTPRGFTRKAMITRRFLARKVAEYEALQAEIEMLRGELGAVTDGGTQGHGAGEGGAKGAGPDPAAGS